MKPDEVQSFLKANNLNYIPLSCFEVEEMKFESDKNTDNEPNHQEDMLDDTQFYKVKFIEVLNLVSSRQCILKSGYAYVKSLDSVIETMHRTYVEKGLSSTCRMMKVIRQDPRIAVLLQTIHTLRPGHDFILSEQSHKRIESIDYLSTKSFPLCARMCHELLREKHHLKYFARHQYQLFLKGIGVSLEDSLK